MAREYPQLQVIPPPSVEENRESTLTTDDPEGCRTPTSRDHKIPSILSCPPAPKKRGKVLSQKRKFQEVQFFEFTGGDEVDSLFKSSFELFRVSSRSVKKKRYTSKGNRA